MNFFVKIAKRGVFWSTGTRLMMWQTNPGGGWRGARDHRAVTTWHWGHVAGRAWPTQEAQGARQMAVRPRGHVGARVRHHVWRSREEILGQLIGESSPLFNRVLRLYFFRVGLCSHTVLTLQATWRLGGRRIGSERRRSRGPESTRSPDRTRA